MTLFSFRNFSFSYSKELPPALSGIDLDIEENECVVVSGLSGAGKSTLCLAAAGLLDTFPASVSAGEIVPGEKGGGTGSATAVVLQNFYAQITYLRPTVLEEIAFRCENLGLPRQETAERAAEAIEMMRIGRLAERNPLELSGGEKQKVVLASALAAKPRLLILDEPLSQLDPETTSYIGGLLCSLKGTTTLLVAENDPYLSLKVADRLVVLSAGKKIADGKPEYSFNKITEEHLELPAWTQCVLEARSRSLFRNDPTADGYELNYRKALSRLRDLK